MLEQYEVPAAYSMVELAQLSSEPFHEFMCYWTAFNSIYAALAEQQGHHARLKTESDGTVKRRRNGSVQVPDAELDLTERMEIELAFGQFDDQLKRDLLKHPSMAFFVGRVPVWHGTRIEVDALGQRLNGVINVKYTSDPSYPVWSPLDTQAYGRYQGGHPTAADIDSLTKQLLFVVYTIRNNTFHGGKRGDDTNDREVIEKGLPLLRMIVERFVPRPHKGAAASVAKTRQSGKGQSPGLGQLAS